MNKIEVRNICKSYGKVKALDDVSLAVAEGEVLEAATHSFGGIAVFSIPEMGRFYRHVLVGKQYPHHGAVAFGHVGKALWTVFQYLGIEDIAYNQPAGTLYATENPFA